MKELLMNYSLEQIIIFIFMIAIALKEGIELFNYFKNLILNKNKEDIEQENKNQEILNEIKEIKKDIHQLQESNERHSEKLDILINSDKEDIKAFIVAKHHYHVEKEHWIDDYTMDVLEKRFGCYKKENGNSYAEALMNEIRALPKHPPKTRLKE